MENEKILVGLDIGTTKVLAVVAKQTPEGHIDILGMGKAPSEGVIRGVITNLDKTVLSIQQSIQQAEKHAGIDIRVVQVGIAGSHIKSSIQHGSITREHADEEITSNDIYRLRGDVRKLPIAPGNEIIHVLPQDYRVDYERNVKDPIGMPGSRLEGDFYVITAQTNAINNIYKCTKRAGLEVSHLMLEPLAASLATLSDEEKEAGVCLVDIGGGTVDIAIFHEGIIRHTAAIPFGGQSLTHDIKIGLQVMEYQAELLKKEFGQAIAEATSSEAIITIPGLRNRPPKEVSLRNLAHIIEARMAEIIELIYAEITNAGLYNKLAAGVVITGGGAQLQSLKQLFESMIGLDTRVGYPSEWLDAQAMDEAKEPMAATAIGLVLANFRQAYDQEAGVDYFKPILKNNPKNQKKEKQSKDLFRRLLNKTKGLLIDDYEN
jgi:cell division protein FtsA